MSTPSVSDRSNASVRIPGALVAKYEDGKITGWVFTPHAASPGWRGASALIDDGDDDLDVETDNGPFWTAVIDTLDNNGLFIVEWQS